MQPESVLAQESDLDRRYRADNRASHSPSQPFGTTAVPGTSAAVHLAVVSKCSAMPPHEPSTTAHGGLPLITDVDPCRERSPQPETAKLSSRNMKTSARTVATTTVTITSLTGPIMHSGHDAGLAATERRDHSASCHLPRRFRQVLLADHRGPDQPQHAERRGDGHDKQRFADANLPCRARRRGTRRSAGPRS